MVTKAYQPSTSEYAPFYSTYVSKVKTENILHLLETQLQDTVTFFQRLPETLHEHRYETGKWSLKEVLGHIIDAERVFSYRLLRISRGDKTALAGFDQNPFVEAGNFDSRSMDNLLEEYKIVRRSTLILAKNLSDEELIQMGTASDSPISARALLYIIAGHEIHHMRIVKERYLP